MEMMPVKPERKAQIEEYAELHDQTQADALDDLLAAQLEWERRDYDDAVRAIRRGYKDMQEGRVQSAEEFIEDLRAEHGFPR
jgi:hypothetical protein